MEISAISSCAALSPTSFSCALLSLSLSLSLYLSVSLSVCLSVSLFLSFSLSLSLSLRGQIVWLIGKSTLNFQEAKARENKPPLSTSEKGFLISAKAKRKDGKKKNKVKKIFGLCACCHVSVFKFG